jgi:hypothetical protein
MIAIFLSFCRPALRNLPIITAYKLAKLKASLQAPNDANPPYQNIQEPTLVQTQPTFFAPRPSYADVLRPQLQPRKDWMKAQPPFLTDDEADRAWHRSNEATFGQQLHEDDIKQQMAILQHILDQRRQTEANNNDSLTSTHLTINKFKNSLTPTHLPLVFFDKASNQIHRTKQGKISLPNQNRQIKSFLRT